MNCQNFETIVSDLARRQIMEANVREQALAHSGECEACALRLEDERMLTFGLRALAAEMNSLEAPDRIQEELLTVFRSRRFTDQFSRSTTRWRYAIAAVAAILLVVGAIAGMRSRLTRSYVMNPGSPENKPAAKKANTTATVKTPGAVDESGHIALPDRKRRVPPRKPRRNDNPPVEETASSAASPGAKQVVSTATVATKDPVTEITTAFMPVGYTTAMNLQEGGQIVRVELPRSTLVAFGLPLNMDRYNQKVKADVFFGADGIARAIRFVQ
jgi:hypothetical protein